MKVEVLNKPRSLTGLDLQLWLVRLAKFAGLGLVAVLTLLPVIRLIIFIASNGADNISNDYYNYAKSYDQILRNDFEWPGQFFHDSFLATHCLIFPFLVSFVIAIVFHWNNYVELYFAIALAGLRLFLIYDTFTYFKKNFTRWLVLPILSALVFSPSQLNNFSFGEPAVAFAINLFGFALAIWALIRFGGRKLGIALIISGGFLATWSGAMGLLVWPIVLGGLYFFNFRRVWHYVVVVVGGAVAALPYLYFLVLARSAFTDSIANRGSGFGFEYVLNALGWSFSNNIGNNFDATQNPMALTAGWFGFGFGVITLALLALAAWKNRAIVVQALPALVLFVFGLLTTFQVGLFRAPAISSWYTTLFIYYWIGLVGLVYVMWVNRPALSNRANQLVFGVSTLWSVGLLGTLIFLYLSSNVTFDDKAFYLYARTPASASCLRHYQVAPPICEGLLFQWEQGNPEFVKILGKGLEQHELSVFAPHQQWILQGDYPFNNVQLEQQSDLPGITWSEDLTVNQVPWNSYKHLNLYMHSPQAVLWTLHLPSNLERADFYSAVALSQSIVKDSGGDGVTFEIYVEQGKARKLVYSRRATPDVQQWQPLSFSLKEYSGQTITLRLTSKPGANLAHDWAMYRYPYIDLDLKGKVSDDPAAIAVAQQPFIVNTSDRDLKFDLNNSAQWAISGLQHLTDVSPNRWSAISTEAFFSSRQALNICLADYSQFYIRMAASPEILNRKLQVSYELEGANIPAKGALYLSLNHDDKFYEYSFDPKLLEAGLKARLMALQLYPVAPDPRIKEAMWTDIQDFRLIRKPGPSLCK